MRFSDTDYAGHLNQGPGSIIVEPLAEGAVQAASIDIRMGNQVREFADDRLGYAYKPIDPAEPDPDETTLIEIPAGGLYILQPKTLVLASSLEYIEVPDWVSCQLSGKSSQARRGLVVHLTAGLVDPGFRGNITLEIYNFRSRPYILRPGMRLGQVEHTQLRTRCTVPYGPDRNSHYTGKSAIGAVASQSHLNVR